LLIACIAACTGKAPVSGTKTPDAPPADAPPVDTSQMLSGKAMDYFGNVALDATTVATDGISPQVSATSGMDGSYQLQIAVGSKLFLVASRTNYRPTRSTPIAVDDTAVTQDAYVMSNADIARQYTTLGLTGPKAGTAVLVADLEKNDGTPLDGIPLTNVQLLDANMQPVTGLIGPYFFACTGDVDTTLTTAPTCTPARDRVAFLDVPPGTYSLAVTYPNGMAGNTQILTSVTTEADGATLALSGGTGPGAGAGSGSGSGAGSGSGSGNATDPTFATDIYPRLQRAAAGGLGCANCHTANGPGAVLIYDASPTTVLANMLATTGVIDLNTPASSLFLVRPLYEQPPLMQDHPNATFLDTNDPNYKLFLLWITNGAKP
jgi:hypothetical protein